MNRTVYGIAGFLSAGIIAFLFWLVYFRPETAVAGTAPSLSFFNASMNLAATLAILGGILAIRHRQKLIHIVMMITATFFSAAFFVGYVIHHYLSGDTHFIGTGWIKAIYLIILASHIVLSIVVLPLILISLYFAVTRQFSMHTKFTPYTYPIWLYVSVTGVLIYVFLKLSGSMG